MAICIYFISVQNSSCCVHRWSHQKQCNWQDSDGGWREVCQSSYWQQPREHCICCPIQCSRNMCYNLTQILCTTLHVFYHWKNLLLTGQCSWSICGMLIRKYNYFGGIRNKYNTFTTIPYHLKTTLKQVLFNRVGLYLDHSSNRFLCMWMGECNEHCKVLWRKAL